MFSIIGLLAASLIANVAEGRKFHPHAVTAFAAVLFIVLFGWQLLLLL